MAKPEDSRAWKVLRRLLPRWYRRRWGEALLRTHRDRATARGGGESVAFWIRLTADVVVTAVQARWTGPESAGGGEREHTETMTGGGWEMSYLVQELGVIVRTLLRRPGYVIPAVLTLGLGIGSATAIFSLVDGVLLDPLPYADADELLIVRDHYEQTGGSGSMSVPNYLDLRDGASGLASFSAYSNASMNVATEEAPERVGGLRVTHDFLETLGIHPILGRDFQEGEDRVGAPSIVLIGHGFWEERFGGSRDALGQTLLLNGEPFEIVGVLPPRFWFPAEPRLLVPFQWDVQQAGRGSRFLSGVARLGEGVTGAVALDELRSLFGRLEEAYPGSNRGWTVETYPVDEWAFGRNRTPLYLLAGAAFMVLLIGCVNVANLMLVRAERRRREIAVRAAMGGGRIRIIRQFVLEGLVVAGLSMVLGFVLAGGALQLLLAVWGADLPRASQVALNGDALLFTLIVATVVAVTIGLVPSLRTDVHRLFGALREGSQIGRRSDAVLQRVLVGVEVALAVVLVTGAGLLLRTAQEVSRVDTGVVLEDALVFSVQLPSASYAAPDEIRRYFDDALDRMTRLPGVEAAGISPRTPLQGGYNVTTVTSSVDPDLESSFVEIRQVSPGFFDAAGIPVLAGRLFSEEDVRAEAQVVVISEALADDLFPGGEAVGGTVDPYGNGNEFRILGVVGSVREFGVLSGGRPAVYWPYGVTGTPTSMTFVVRSSSDDPLELVPDIRRIMSELDRTIPLYSVRSLEDVAEETLGSRPLATQIFTVFAGMALLLAAVGIFGVLAYVVEQRTTEIGIRMAMGADARTVVGDVVGEALRLVVLGLVLGVAGAIAAGHFLGSALNDILFQVAPNDVPTMIFVVTVIATVSALAAWLPARRAAGVPPTEALRST